MQRERQCHLPVLTHTAIAGMHALLAGVKHPADDLNCSSENRAEVRV